MRISLRSRLNAGRVMEKQRAVDAALSRSDEAKAVCELLCIERGGGLSRQRIERRAETLVGLLRDFADQELNARRR